MKNISGLYVTHYTSSSRRNSFQKKERNKEREGERDICCNNGVLCLINGEHQIFIQEILANFIINEQLIVGILGNLELVNKMFDHLDERFEGRSLTSLNNKLVR